MQRLLEGERGAACVLNFPADVQSGPEDKLQGESEIVGPKRTRLGAGLKGEAYGCGALLWNPYFLKAPQACADDSVHGGLGVSGPWAKPREDDGDAAPDGFAWDEVGACTQEKQRQAVFGGVFEQVGALRGEACGAERSGEGE